MTAKIVYMPLIIETGIRTVNALNVREHPLARARRAKRERATAKLSVLAFHASMRPPLPVTVTLTRLGPRTLDTDGLAAALKHVRDGIADAYGCDDSAKAPIAWGYAQEKAKDYGVRITIATDGGHR